MTKLITDYAMPLHAESAYLHRLLQIHRDIERRVKMIEIAAEQIEAEVKHTEGQGKE